MSSLDLLALYSFPTRRSSDLSEKPIVIKDGRFGPYITDGTTNVSLRATETVEEITESVAIEKLAVKRAKGPAKKPARKATAKKAPAKRASTTRRSEERRVGKDGRPRRPRGA